MANESQLPSQQPRNEFTRRVEDTFGSPDASAIAQGYLQNLREAGKDYGDAMGKSLTGAFLLIAVFELISQAAIERISLGGFQISNLSLIHKALPVVIAYFTYAYYQSGIDLADLNGVYYAVSKLVQPKLHRNQFDRVILAKPHPLTFSSVMPRENERFIFDSN
jgi:hypothetical protein